MAKKNITKILEKGSHKQRAALLFVNSLNEGLGKRTLTKEEEDALDASFSAPGAASVFNEYRAVYIKIKYLLTLLEGFMYAYGKDTLMESVMLERFMQTYNYRALVIGLLEVGSEEVNSLLESRYSPPWAYMDKEGFTLKESHYKNLFKNLRNNRENQLKVVKTAAFSIDYLMEKYNLGAATAFIEFRDQIIKKKESYESSLVYSLFYMAPLLNTENVAYLRAYTSKEPNLILLQPIFYEEIPVDEAAANIFKSK
jgi:hypothetical protein